METLQQWFNNDCPYQEGVVLYENHPKCNRNLLTHFKKKHTALLHEKLKYELRKFLDKPHLSVKTIKTALKPTVVTSVNVEELTSVISLTKKQSLYFYQLPEQLRPVLLEANQLFKENCYLKSLLNDLPASAENKALELQLQIARNFKQNALCWKKIDYYQEHKVLAETAVSEFESLTPAALLRKQQLLYASISKLNTRLKTNRILLKDAFMVADKNKLERMIAKQENNLIKQNEQLLTITNLIDGK
jgi:hypothetical protein